MLKKITAVPVVKSVIIGVAVGLVLAAVSYYNLLGNLERRSYDMLLSGEAREPSSDILIVGITESCVGELGSWPWRRDIHGRLLNVLTEGNAAVVGMDIIFSEESLDPETDRAMVEATRDAVPVVYPVVGHLKRSERDGFFTSDEFSYVFPALREVSEAGFINVASDPDGILRKVPLWMEYRDRPLPSFSLLIWAISQGYTAEEFENHLAGLYEENPSALPVGDFEFPLDPRGQTLINYSAGPHTFPVVPYHSVINGDIPPAMFEDRIVLVGYYALGLGDYYFTPFQKDLQMFGIEVHANIINTLMKAGPVNSLTPWHNMALVFLLALLFMIIYQVLRPFRGFLLLVFSVIAFYIIASYMFNSSLLYIETVYPMLALAGSYLTSLFYTFITEQRERQRVTRIFGRYVAQQVVDQILEVGEENLKLGGTRKNVSLLFIDIRGFTPLSEKLPPEKVVEILNEYFEIVTRCIFENKGMVDKFMGDAVMAIFNAPMDLEDHAVWALRAAQDIIAGGAALQKKVFEMAGVNLYFGIGINTGDAVVGNIGAENRYEYTAIGDTVNLAARLESNAKKGQVLVSRYVYDAVGDKIPLKPVGEITVKGKSQPIEVYELDTSVEEDSVSSAQ